MNRKTMLPADDHAYALLPERRRAKMLIVSHGQHVPRSGAAPRRVPRRADGVADRIRDEARAKLEGFDAIIFDGATPAELPRANAIYLDPRGPGSPVKVENEIKQPGFDKIDRKHPIVRFTALDNVNIARAHKLEPEPGDKVIGASDDGPIFVAGTRGGFKFVAIGFDVRESDLPLRVAWPLLLLNSINWFTDEDSQYLSSFRTGDVWRIPVGQGRTRRRSRCPAAPPSRCPCTRGARSISARTRASTISRSRARRLPKHEPEHEWRPAGRFPSEQRRALRREPPRRHRERDRAASRRSPSTAKRPAPSSASTWACGVRFGSTCSSSRSRSPRVEWVTYHRRLTV